MAIGVGSSLLLVVLGVTLGALGQRGGWPSAIVVLAGGTPIIAGLLTALRLRIAWAIEEELRAELESLRAEQAASRLESASLAHDLRAPLVTVRSYLELLAEDSFGELPEQARTAATSAAQATSRAQSIVETTLRSRAERSAPRAVNMNSLIDEVTAALAADLKRVRAQIEIGDLPEVIGDGDAIYRVLENLLQNALKFTPPGERPRVEVTAAVRNGQCEIGVRDWGTGIAASERERVFEVGERGDAGAVEGRGLGLATVRRLVTELGGRVWIDPDVADGTLVRVALPAAPDSSPHAA